MSQIETEDMGLNIPPEADNMVRYLPEAFRKVILRVQLLHPNHHTLKV